MNYLKFNESRKSRNRLQEYCNEHLIDAIESGISIEIDIYPPYEGAPYHWVQIIRRTSPQLFNWSDISDRLIPFFIVLKDEFILHTMSDAKNLNIIPNITSFMCISYKGLSNNIERNYYTYEQVINNEVDTMDTMDIYYINFTTWKDGRKRV